MDLYEWTMGIFALKIKLHTHMSCENYEESGYGLELDLLTISY